jgi:hypothetical protein
VPFPVQVLAESVVSDGLGHRHVTGYRYRDGWYAPDTREFRGFAQVVRTELGDASEATAVQVHAFDLGQAAECRKGSLLSLEARTETGALLVRDTYVYATRTATSGLDGRAVAWAERTKHEAEHWEGGSSSVTTREEWTHDDYGNVLVHSEWGIVEGSNTLAGHDERITTSGYLNDADRWLLGRAFHKLVADGAGERLSESYTYYDGEPFQGLGLGQLGTAGAPTRTVSWVAGDHFAETERLQRDEYGLVTATLDPLGARREVDYDPDGVRVLEVSLHQDGPRALIRFDLNEFPKQPPAKWMQSRANRVQIRLMGIGVRDMEIRGWSANDVADINVAAASPDGLRLVAQGEGFYLKGVFEHVAIDGVSAYRDAAA